MLADRIIVTTDGDHTSVEVIVGLIHTYRRDMLCLNNSVMDTIIRARRALLFPIKCLNRLPDQTPNGEATFEVPYLPYLSR